MRRYGIRIQWLFGYVAGFCLRFPCQAFTEISDTALCRLWPTGEPGGRAPAGAHGTPWSRYADIEPTPIKF